MSTYKPTVVTSWSSAASVNRPGPCRRWKRLASSVSVTLLVAGAAGCAPAGGSHTPQAATLTASQPTQEFAGLFRGYRSDYEPAKTSAELAKRSEAVALGRLIQIREGRVLGASRTDPGRLENLLFVFEVEQRYRGDLPRGKAYVEVPKPGTAPAAAFEAKAPRGARALMFLERASDPARGERAIPPSSPLPDGTPLWWFTTPQGLLINVAGAVTAPLEVVRPIFPLGDPDAKNLPAWLPPELAPTTK
jgi:hypothetical protein